MARFRACFAELVDPRTGNAQRHDLLEILLIALAATLCGAEGGVDMARFGRAKAPFLRRCLRLEGVPEHHRRTRLSPVQAPQRRPPGAVVRSHWPIENGLHWVLDVVMDEDRSRACKDHGPENLARLRRFALNLRRANRDRGSTRGKIKRAGWDDAFLLQILAAA